MRQLFPRSTALPRRPKDREEGEAAWRNREGQAVMIEKADRPERFEAKHWRCM